MEVYILIQKGKEINRKEIVKVLNFTSLKKSLHLRIWFPGDHWGNCSDHILYQVEQRIGRRLHHWFSNLSYLCLPENLRKSYFTHSSGEQQIPWNIPGIPLRSLHPLQNQDSVAINDILMIKLSMF